MKKRIIKIIAAVCVLLSFSSCSLKIQSADSLIRAPKLTGDNQLVQQALDKSVGENIIQKTPVKGEYSSSFVFRDIDNDSVSECISFYSLKDDDSVHMNILDSKDGKWFSVCDTVGDGSEVYSLVFADVDGDDRDEIIVTWSIPESKGNKYLSVFGRYSESSGVVSLVSEMFTSFHIFDVNGDGSDEIFTVLNSTAGDRYVAGGKLFVYNKSKSSIELVSEIKLDNNVTSYLNICHDFEGAVCRVYIDGVVSETHVMTQVLTIGSADMRMASIAENGDFSEKLTLRSGRSLCSDINGDGYVEIPSYEPMPGGEVTDRVNALTQALYLTTWKRFTDGGFTDVYRYYENTADGYNFLVPAEWIGNTALVYDIKLSRLKCFRTNDKNEIGELLFYIDCCKSEPDNNGEEASDRVVFEDNDAVFYCRITDVGAEAGIDFADLTAYFIRT